MYNLRKVLIAMALLAAGPVTATAADLGAEREGNRDTIVRAGRIYLRGDIGFSWNSATSITENTVPMADPSFGRNAVYGGGVGWYVTPHWRVDATLEQRSDVRAHGNAAGAVPLVPGIVPPNPRRFDITSTMVMANVYYDVTDRQDFNPYLGAGIGMAVNTSHNGQAEIICGGPCSTDEISQTNFAWALMAGFTQPIVRGWTMDAGYRFSDIGGARTGFLKCCGAAAQTVYPGTEQGTSNIYGHEFRIGLRYDAY
jgi:opacity protein-like surface antigen